MRVIYLQPTFLFGPPDLLIYNPSSFFRKSENNQRAEQHNAEALITRGSTLFHTTTGLLQQLLSILIKRIIYGCVAVTMRQSHYHIDRLPDGLSSLITSWPVDKYLFEMRMGEEECAWWPHSAACMVVTIYQEYFQPSLTFSYHKLVSCLRLFSAFHTLPDLKRWEVNSPGDEQQ